MTKRQKMKLRNKLRAKFIERIERGVAKDVENEGLRVMSDYLTSYYATICSEVLAFMKMGDDWSFAECARGVETLRRLYIEFDLTPDVMSLETFVSQYSIMYASEAVRTIHEWRERNGIGVETAY